MKSSRGFTLIELLVVIAIIGILSAVVLASLSTARQKAQDSAILSNMEALQVQAELYYSNNNNYGVTSSNSCITPGSLWVVNAGIPTIVNVVAAVQALSGAGNVNCYSKSSAYAMSAKLIATTTVWTCVDSTGASLNLGSAVTSTCCAGSCP